MNLVDLLILFFLIMGAVNGFKKGFLNSIIGLFSTVLGLIVAIKYYSYLTQWAEAKFQVVTKLGHFFTGYVNLPQSVGQLQLGTKALSDISSLFDNLNLSEGVKSQLLETIANLGDKLALTATTNVGEVLGIFLAETIIKLIAIIIIWQLVARIAIFLSRFITNFTQGTILGTVNRLGGLFSGVLLTMLSLTIFFGLISPFLEIVQQMEQSSLAALAKTISESHFVPHFTTAFSFWSKKLLVL